MQMKNLIRVIALAAIFILSALPFIVASPALATDPPDSDPFADNVHCYQHLLEENDRLLVGEYHIPYGTLPDETATLTYTFVLIDDTGNQVGFAVPYAYFDKGYNLGVFSMYWPASTAPEYADNFTLRIAQNPAYFASPQNYDFGIDASVCSTDNTTEGNQAELYTTVIAYAEDMAQEFTSYEFTESSVNGIVLYSPTGENYFRNAIYGIQSMCPDLFLYQLAPYDTDVATYTVNNTYENQYTGTWVETSQNATADQFGLSPQAVMAGIFALPVCVGFIVVSAKKYHKAEPGFLCASLVLLATYLMGWMPAAIFASIYQAMGIYLAYVWFYSRG